MTANAFGGGESAVVITEGAVPDDDSLMPSLENLELPLAPPGTMGPPEEYNWMRERAPVTKLSVPAEFNATIWYVTSYNDVKSLLADSRLIRPTINEWPKIENQPEDIGTPLVTMMEFNGPQAIALRRVVAQAFSAKTIQAYRPRMRAKADEMLADLAKRGQPGDIVRDYTEPFPLWVMCDLVGIPFDDRDHYLPLADAALGAMQTWEQGRNSTEELYRYIRSIIEKKSRRPADDILSRVVHEWKKGTIDEEAVTAFGLSMLVAGYRTTTMFLGNSLLLLLSTPSRYAMLRDERHRLPGAVEELLRFIPVLNGIVVLLATEDIEYNGKVIRSGDAVLPVIAAGNRDESVFPGADELDLCRVDNPHLVFGRGAHNCIAAVLARTEMAVGIEALLDRFPNLRLTDGRPATWDDSAPAKSPITLFVDW
jgi:cytochrome P450